MVGDIPHRDFTGFVDTLKTEHIHGNAWRLLEPFTFYWKGRRVTAPAGFVTDYVSVGNSVLLALFGRPSGKACDPSVIHDFLYSTNSDRLSISQEEADEIFLVAMEIREVNWFRRRGMHRGVRLFGHKFFKES